MRAVASIGKALGAGGLAAVTLSCDGRVTAPSAADGPGAGALNLGAASGAGGSSGVIDFGGSGAGGFVACPECPSQSGLVQCCSDGYCGYRNDQLHDCIPSVIGGDTLYVVEAPDGELCTQTPDCVQSDGCPLQVPTDHSSCKAPMTCHYCMGRKLARTMTCIDGRFVTVGPDVPCARTIEPTH